jgi:hypothetical protein
MCLFGIFFGACFYPILTPPGAIHCSQPGHPVPPPAPQPDRRALAGPRDAMQISVILNDLPIDRPDLIGILFKFIANFRGI